MHSNCTRLCKTAGGIGVWLALALVPGLATAQRNDNPNDNGAEVLTRGPVHEAFANLSESENAPGDIYRKSPPDDIEELPPDQRPDGENVSWIPGYWSFDDDRQDYIWVSGVWRDVPPNRQWVPGYWNSVRGGSQFVSGFWSDVGRTEVEYLPHPPEPLEVGPSSPSIGRDANWSPGSWVWVEQRYAWQPGYWVATQPNWVWTPARYVWTPRGYVYVSAYWDYDISRRGVMFAPVYYASPVYRRPNYYYSPSIVIDLSFAFGSLFVHSHSRHYYYGDYYDYRYRDRGYEPWYSRHDRHDRNDHYYREDPIFVSYRSEQLRRDKDWDSHNREQYTYRREHVEARPAQTYAQQIEANTSRRSDDRQLAAIARPLDQVVKSESQLQRFRPVDSDRRKEYQTRAREVKQYRAERQQIEAEPEATTSTTQAVERAEQPTSQEVNQPATRDGRRIQTERGPSKRPSKAVTDSGKGSVRVEQPVSQEVNQPATRDGGRIQTDRAPSKRPSKAATDSGKDAVRVEQPVSQEVKQPATRDGGRIQTERAQSKRPSNAVTDSGKGSVRVEQPASAKEDRRPARQANQPQAPAKQTAVEPVTSPDAARSEERARPIRKQLRESPITAKGAKSAPAAPDIPRPVDKEPGPAGKNADVPKPAPDNSNPEAKAQESTATKSSPGDGKQQKTKGRDTTESPNERSQKKGGRNPR